MTISELKAFKVKHEAVSADAFSAAKSGDVAKMIELINAHSNWVVDMHAFWTWEQCDYYDPVCKEINEGSTPLIEAVANNHVAMTEFLLKNGADPNRYSAGEHGIAPIHIACSLGNKRIIELLLERGASLKEAHFDPAGCVAYTPLIDAVIAGQHDMVDYLLKNGADPNMTSFSLEYPRPIHYACMQGPWNLIELLRDNGATLDIPFKKDQTGVTCNPEHLFAEAATTEEFVNLRPLLESLGFDFDKKDSAGKSAYYRRI